MAAPTKMTQENFNQFAKDLRTKSFTIKELSEKYNLGPQSITKYVKRIKEAAGDEAADFDVKDGRRGGVKLNVDAALAAFKTEAEAMDAE